MTLLISFSGRAGGNGDQIADYIAADGDKIVHFRDLHAHPCANCAYECFDAACKYRADGVYDLYSDMLHFDRVILLVPLYGGHPASLYFAFQERGQDFFTHNDVYDELLRRLYIIGIYGSAERDPDFLPTLEKWFTDTPYKDRVLGLERHRYGQKLRDNLLDVPEVRAEIDAFLHGTSRVHTTGC